jgi:peptidoglycan LD-endopeptidase LytH
MRSTVSFLIGAVLGATGVLVYLHETRQLAMAAEPAIAQRAGMVPADSRAVSTRSTAVAKKNFDVNKVTGLMVPVEGVLRTSLRRDFADNRGGGRTHGALDIRAPRGTPVIAATDGTIKKLFTSKAGGLTIYQYDNAEELCYYYAHLDRYADGIKEGQRVSAGDVIGYVGITGNAPIDAPHLHFAINVLPPTKEWWKGDPIDPYTLLTAE